MPKFEQVEVTDKDGKVKRVLVPLDRGAKAMSICYEAINAGAYTPKKGETPEEMKKKNQEYEAEMARKGIGLPRM